MTVRQHLIDPEVCIRCNTCEEKCPTGAITHDKRNYVVLFDKCDACGDCLPPCPTGAIPVLEGQSIGVIPPDGSHVRLYSVASPRDGERPKHNNLALTVKRVTVDHDGRPVRGVCSNYLCDLEKGAQVKIVGPYGASFLMPNHPGARLLLVCTGTGAAPMRAMTERRRRRLALAEGGDILLFFGARRREELPYFGPLMKLPRELIEVELAFSRAADRPKEYVQDRMRARHERVFEMLADDRTHAFVCGHKRMEEGVLGALEDICAKHGARWSDRMAEMRREGRFHIETY